MPPAFLLADQSWTGWNHVIGSGDIKYTSFTIYQRARFALLLYRFQLRKPRPREGCQLDLLQEQRRFLRSIF